MRNKIYTLLLVLMFILGIMIFILPQRESSILERRNLSVNTDINKDEFSKSINNIMNDQFLFRDKSIKTITKLKQLFNIPFNKKMLKINDNMVSLDGNYFINEFVSIKPQDKETALNRAYNIKQISKKYPNIKTYVYLPTRIEETKLLDTDKYISQYPELKEQFISELGDLVKTSSLNINSVEDFYKYFYKTDFHWNGYGVYEGYKDIIELINKDFEIGAPKEATFITYPYDFYGNYAPKIAFECAPDKLIDMNVETPVYKYYVNGKLSDDEEFIKEYKNNGNLKPLYSDYEYVYGANDFERIYDFNQPDKPNILIFADSYINPIKKALASHFNKTIIIDMRANDGKFNLDEYIKKYNIDVILFLQYYEDLYFNGYLFVPLD